MVLCPNCNTHKVGSNDNVTYICLICSTTFELTKENKTIIIRKGFDVIM